MPPPLGHRGLGQERGAEGGTAPHNRPAYASRVRLVPLDLSDVELARELLALQRRAYRVEAELIGSNKIPPLRESLPDLRACGETFLGAFLGGRLVGAVSWKLVGKTIDLHRLVVDSDHARRGIGIALVRAALAANPRATRAIVQTGAANEPARRLYLREGFRFIDEIEPIPGLRVARFSKDLVRTELSLETTP
jgi:GNAT superfamily N-acetyltransferase